MKILFRVSSHPDDLGNRPEEIWNDLMRSVSDHTDDVWWQLNDLLENQL